MKKRSITLNDIAREAGVSLMTVSRALRKEQGVRPEIRTRIQELAQRMGYIPYRCLYAIEPNKTTKTVGVVIPHLANTIFPYVIQELEFILSANGYRILLCCNNNNINKEFQDISALLEHQPSGIVWAPLHVENSLQSAKLIKSRQCPLVFLDRKLPGIEEDAVLVDDFQGAKDAVLHLIDQNRSKIAFLRPVQESYVAQERQRGFLEALREANLPVDENWIIPMGSTLKAGRCGIKKILQWRERPDAIFCFNDPLAIGAEMELLKQGIAIPEEIALVGFSGVSECEFAGIALTTVHQDATGLGQTAAELLLNKMINPGIVLNPTERILKTRLIIRESTSSHQTPSRK